MLYTPVAMKRTVLSEKIPLTCFYALMQAGSWMSFCVAVSYSAVFLQGLSFSNAELGAVMACGNLLGAGLGMELSVWIDRSERMTAERLLLPILTVQTAMLVLLHFYAGKNAVTPAAYICYVATSVAVNAMNLKLYADISHRGGRVNFGVARGMGSAAYVLMSVGLGQLIERHSPMLLPNVGLLLCLFQTTAFLLMQNRMESGRDGDSVQRELPETGSSVRAFFRENRCFGIMLAGSALIFFAHNTLGNYMINVVRFVGGDTGSMGLLNGFSAMAEIPVMLLYQQLFGRKNPAGLLKISFICFAAKAFAVANAVSVPTLTAALALQAPSFALYTTAIVPYVERIIPYRDSAKAQTLAFNMTTLGSVLASLLGGMLYDSAGVRNTLWIAVVIAVVGLMVTLTGLHSGTEKHRGRRKQPVGT